MKYFQTFKNKFLNLFGVKKQPKFAFKKNRIDFISMPEGMSERERLIHGLQKHSENRAGLLLTNMGY